MTQMIWAVWADSHVLEDGVIKLLFVLPGGAKQILKAMTFPLQFVKKTFPTAMKKSKVLNT